MPNRAVELHDSQVASIRWEGGTCVIELAAHMHESDGTPGVDAGTGWTQPAQLTLHGAQAELIPGTLPLWILDGSVKVGNTLFENMLPIPFESTGITRLRLLGADGVLQVSGSGLSLQPTGVAEYLEDFPGAS